MTDTEFYAGLAVLTAAGIPEMGEKAQELYLTRLRGLPDGAFSAGVCAIVDGELCADLVQYRRLPTLHELRSACAAQARAPRGRPYVAGVPLPELLQAASGEGDEPLAEEAADLVARVATRAAAPRGKLLLGPGNAGHRALAQRPVDPLPASELTEEQWEARRRRLLEQGDELLGPGECVG